MCVSRQASGDKDKTVTWKFIIRKAPFLLNLRSGGEGSYPFSHQRLRDEFVDVDGQAVSEAVKPPSSKAVRLGAFM